LHPENGHPGIFQGASANARIEFDREESLTQLLAGLFDDRSNVFHSTVV
jgi:hypothetical protein